MAASLGVLRGPNEGWCGQVGWAPLMCQGNRNEISGYALVFFFFFPASAIALILNSKMEEVYRGSQEAMY